MYFIIVETPVITYKRNIKPVHKRNIKPVHKRNISWGCIQFLSDSPVFNASIKSTKMEWNSFRY